MVIQQREINTYPFTSTSTRVLNSSGHTLDPSLLIGVNLFVSTPFVGKVRISSIYNIGPQQSVMIIKDEVDTTVCSVYFNMDTDADYITGVARSDAGEFCGYIVIKLDMVAILRTDAVFDREAFTFLPRVISYIDNNYTTPSLICNDRVVKQLTVKVDTDADTNLNVVKRLIIKANGGKYTLTADNIYITTDGVIGGDIRNNIPTSYAAGGRDREESGLRVVTQSDRIVIKRFNEL